MSTHDDITAWALCCAIKNNVKIISYVTNTNMRRGIVYKVQGLAGRKMLLFFRWLRDRKAERCRVLMQTERLFMSVRNAEKMYLSAADRNLSSMLNCFGG